jgi:diguanylate cyclase (GGDEF)-like protein
VRAEPNNGERPALSSFPSTSIGNPLRAMPSVLAIRDLDRRWRRVVDQLHLDDDVLTRLLQLDPLAVVRGLRATNAKVFRQGNDAPTVSRMVRHLGPALSRRLLDVDPVAVAGTSPIRMLWRHAIATALAAEDLARSSGLMEPEAGYLLGLLHDLPTWLGTIETTFRSTRSRSSQLEWLAHWQLPAPLLALLRALPQHDRVPEAPTDAASLVRCAEHLAVLADFPHPDADDHANAVAKAERSDLLAAQRLRRRVEGTLRGFGLDPTIPDAEGELTAGLPLAGKRRGELDEAMLSILGCTRSERYRGIVTALLAAAVRFGGYDRAFYARWNKQGRTLILRSKADTSSRRLTEIRLPVAQSEVAVLEAALKSEYPCHLIGEIGRANSLLAALSCDELLAVPLNRDFLQPAFLLLDRSLTLAPIELELDRSMAMTLGMTGALLNENLLLRRRRQRAQKFAFTDPLTRLFNRRMGLTSLEQEVARAQRSQRPLTVLMCDLDHFKQLNDTLGHLQGDSALRATADVLRQTLRKSDMICRYGGEEFLVVCADTTPDEATVLATRLFTAIAARGEQLGLPLTVSIGLTTFRPDDTVEAMLQRADRALYASKGQGRNRFSADIESHDDPAPAR